MKYMEQKLEIDSCTQQKVAKELKDLQFALKQDSTLQNDTPVSQTRQAATIYLQLPAQ